MQKLKMTDLKVVGFAMIASSMALYGCARPSPMQQCVSFGFIPGTPEAAQCALDVYKANHPAVVEGGGSSSPPAKPIFCSPAVVSNGKPTGQMWCQ